jgi:hypothetical protein
MLRRLSRTRIVALAAAAVILVALLSAQASVASRLAPAFTLELLDGGIAEYKGSPVILLFWAPW